jgi:ABC-2 type transport system ATP-binding protein
MTTESNPLSPAAGVRAVETERLTFSYGERRALDGVTFAVRQGEIFGLLGPNGGGKTTLFRILSTLLPPESGRAAVFGIDTGADPLAVRRRLGVVFQNQSLDRRLTPEENLRYQGRLYGLTGALLDERIGEALRQTGVAERRRDPVAALSGGLRQRVELAKALLHRPDLLLLDEPSTGVDPGVRGEFWRYLEALRRNAGTTVLLTTHLLEEADQCDRLAILDQGRLVAEGSPGELKSGIGGDVVSLTAANPEAVSLKIERQFGVRPSLVDGTLRFEHENGAELISRLARAITEPIQSISVARPSLADVFLRATGRTFSGADAALQSPLAG